MKVDDPDKIEPIIVDRSKLPPGQYYQIDFEARQVFDVDIARVVIEYRAKVVEDDNGNRLSHTKLFIDLSKARHKLKSGFRVVVQWRVAEFFDMNSSISMNYAE